MSEWLSSNRKELHQIYENEFAGVIVVREDFVDTINGALTRE